MYKRQVGCVWVGCGPVPGPHRAGGGRVQPGVAYLVNEGMHDEVFVPKVGGTILNRQQMKDVFGGSGSGPGTVNNNYYITSNDGSAVYAAIQKSKAEAVAEAEVRIDRNLGRLSTTRTQAGKR